MKDAEKEGGGTCGSFCIKKEEQGKGEGRKANCKRGEKCGIKRKKLTIQYIYSCFFMYFELYFFILITLDIPTQSFHAFPLTSFS